eukprot:UN05995
MFSINILVYWRTMKCQASISTFWRKSTVCIVNFLFLFSMRYAHGCLMLNTGKSMMQIQ